MARFAYITKKLRQKNNWKAPYGPVPEPVPGLFCWKPELKGTQKLPQSVLKNPNKSKNLAPPKRPMWST